MTGSICPHLVPMLDYASNLNVFTSESLSATFKLPAPHIRALCYTFMPAAILQIDISMPRRIFGSKRKREVLTLEWIKFK
jgi:hypothetical protein